MTPRQQYDDRSTADPARYRGNRGPDRNGPRTRTDGGWPPSQIAEMHRTHGNRALHRLADEGNLQRNLGVGRADDRYEREAERVADEIVWMPDPQSGGRKTRTRTGPDVSQRSQPGLGPRSDRGSRLKFGRPWTGTETRSRMRTANGVLQMCARCRSRFREGELLNCPECEQTLLQKATNIAREAAGSAAEHRIHALQGGGLPLPERVRSFFEPWFGYDFGDIRIHTGQRADGAARAVNATAFTGNWPRPARDQGALIRCHETEEAG